MVFKPLDMAEQVGDLPAARMGGRGEGYLKCDMVTHSEDSSWAVLTVLVVGDRILSHGVRAGGDI